MTPISPSDETNDPAGVGARDSRDSPELRDRDTSVDENAAPPADQSARASAPNEAHDAESSSASDVRAGGREASVTHRGALIVVRAHRNAEGAWIADLSITRDGQPLDPENQLSNVQPITPEWINEAEALRAGIEHGIYLVDKILRGTPA